MSERKIGLRLQLNGVNQTITSIKDLEKELELAKEDLKELEIGSDLFKELSKEIGNAEVQLKKLNDQSKGLDFKKQAQAFTKFSTGIISGFAGATAALQLFGKDTTEVSKAAVQAQNLLTIAISARGVAEGITQVKIVATTVATVAQTVATNAANISLKALWATMLANPITAVLAGVGLLVSAMVTFTSSTNAAAMAQERLNKSIEESNKIIKNTSTLIGSYNKQISSTTEKLQLQGATLQEIFETTQRLRKQQIDAAKERLIQLNNEIDKSEEIIKGLKKQNKSLDDIKKAEDELNNTKEKRIELASTYADLVEKQQLEELRNNKRLLENERANRRNRIQLIQDSFTRELKLLKDKYDDDLEEARIQGRELTNITKKYENDRKELIKKNKDEIIEIAKQIASELSIVEGNSFIQRKKIIEEEFQLNINRLQQRLISLKANNVLTVEEENKLNKAIDDLGKIREERIKRLNREVRIDSLKSQVELNEKSKELGLIQLQTDDEINEKRKKIFENNFNTFKEIELEKFNVIKELEKIKDSFIQLGAKEDERLIKQISFMIEGLKRQMNAVFDTLEEYDVYFEELYKKEESLFEDRKILFDAEFDAFKEKELLKRKEFLTSQGLEKKAIDSILKETEETYEKLRILEFKKAEDARLTAELNKELNKITQNEILRTLELEGKLLERKKEIRKEIEGSGVEDIGARTKLRNEANKKILKEEQTFQKNLIKIQIDSLEQKLRILEKDPTLNPEEYKRIKNQILKLQDEYDTIEFNNLQDNFKGRLKVIGDFLNEFSNIVDQLSSLTQMKFSFMLERMEADFKNTMTNFENLYQQQLDTIVGDSEEANQRRLEIEIEFGKKRDELEKIAENNRKKVERDAQLSSLRFTLAQTIANGAQAFVNALASLPPPANAIVAAAQSVLTVAQVALVNEQIGFIQSQPLARGGFVRGRSHDQGGVKYQGGGVELEGNEAVINRRSTLKYGPLLSQINESGGGRPLLVNNIMDSRLAEVLASVKSEPIRAYILESEITKAQAVNRRLEELATF